MPPLPMSIPIPLNPKYGQKTMRHHDETLREGGRQEPIDKILKPFQEFLAVESSSGILLIAATILALVWANSPWAELYQRLRETRITIGVGTAVLSKPVLLWINDGLMAVFFFTVGLEIKREVLVGELAEPRQALLPLVAAVGGMVVPAGLFVAANWGRPTLSGWGIPMATDIAFALGIISMLGKRVPLSLKVFLTALAIADDLGAVLVIALFYTSQVSLGALVVAGITLLLMLLCNRLGIRTPLVYFLLGAFMWLAFLLSGVHATVGGVLAAMTIPASTRIDVGQFLQVSRRLLDRFEQTCQQTCLPRGGSMLSNQEQHHLIQDLKRARRRVEPPLQRLEHAHHSWVAFAIMPLFALANAGISFEGGLLPLLVQPVAWGTGLGLIAGKQMGVMLFSWLVIRFLPQSRPAGASWRQIYGVSCLCGIGFTMSIFIASLALPDPAHLDAAKAGILVASLISGVLGYLVLRSGAQKRE